MGVGVSAILLAASCSDTWDEHYNPSEGTSATETLWEQIVSNPNLSRFASIAEKAVYYKDQVHPLNDPNTKKPYTYKDMLSGTQLMTVWAPENSALSEEDVQYYLNLLETNPYSVHQQLMANSIALWRSVATGEGIDTLQMINGKRLKFDKGELSMQGVSINEKNIEAKNGALHTLTGKLPFNYNLYEYLKDYYNSKENNVMHFHDYVLATDTTYFVQNNSIEGNPDINGNPTYVDSAYVNTNMMFYSTKRTTNSNSDKNLTYMESFGANIEGEDSDFIMIIPNDAAWEAAYEKLKPLYNYASHYVDAEKGNSNVKATRDIADEEMDSITNQSINMDIISPLVFNAHRQPKRSLNGPLWSTEELLKANDADIEYLINTFGDTLRTDADWTKTNLWTGKKQVKMSNGYGIITENWDMPKKLYQPDLTIEVGWGSWYNQSSFTGSNTPYSFSNKEWCDTIGKVSFNNFYDLQPSGDGSSIKVSFKLLGTDGENRESEVMSGTYDIGIVCVPDFYKTSNDTIEGDTVRHKITAELSYCNNEYKGGQASNAVEKIQSKDAIVYEGLKVDTVWLFKDFKFPYSYKNMRFCYPTLTLGTYSVSNDRNGKNGYPVFKNNLCIDRIVLVAKDNKEEEDGRGNPIKE